MGVMWDDEFSIDLALPFGLRHGASAIVAIAEAKHGTKAEAYIDDAAGVAMPDR